MNIASGQFHPIYANTLHEERIHFSQSDVCAVFVLNLNAQSAHFYEQIEMVFGKKNPEQILHNTQHINAILVT